MRVWMFSVVSAMVVAVSSGGSLPAEEAEGDVLAAADPIAGMESCALAPGDSVERVRDVLGEPRGYIGSGRRELFFYDRGKVEVRDGLVTCVELVSAEEAETRRLAQEQRRREAALSAQRRREREAELAAAQAQWETAQREAALRRRVVTLESRVQAAEQEAARRPSRAVSLVYYGLPVYGYPVVRGACPPSAPWPSHGRRTAYRPCATAAAAPPLHAPRPFRGPASLSGYAGMSGSALLNVRLHW